MRWQECRWATAGSGADVIGRRLCLRLRGAGPAFRLFRGRSSDEQSAGLSSERPPVRVRSSPLHGGRGVTASIRGREPRRYRFESGRPPLTSGDVAQRDESTSLAPRRSRFESCRLHLLFRRRRPEPHVPVVETVLTPGSQPGAAGSTPAGGTRSIGNQLWGRSMRSAIAPCGGW
jgi:hypothetical protein